MCMPRPIYEVACFFGPLVLLQSPTTCSHLCYTIGPLASLRGLGSDSIRCQRYRSKPSMQRLLCSPVLSCSRLCPKRNTGENESFDGLTWRCAVLRCIPECCGIKERGSTSADLANTFKIRRLLSNTLVPPRHNPAHPAYQSTPGKAA
jgi:hypothetical protein